jgi:hypothetical protein
MLPGTTPSYKPTGEVILEAGHVTKDFSAPDGRPLPVLEGISLQLTSARLLPCSASPDQASPPYCAASRD